MKNETDSGEAEEPADKTKQHGEEGRMKNATGRAGGCARNRAAEREA